MVVSGHTKDPAILLSEDVSLLAAFQGTLIVLMGVSKLEKICAALIEHGKSKDIPAALISSKEIKRSHTLLGTLATLPDLYLNNPLPAPAVLVIGKAAAFSFQTEKWIGSTCTPEFNKKIEQYLPGNYHLYSFMDCVQSSIPFSTEEQELLLDLDNTWLIFTSAKGVKTFIEQYLEKYDIRNLFPSKIACIGQGTAQTLLQYGIHPDFVGQNDSTKSMAKKLQILLDKEARVFTIREKNAGFELEEILAQNYTVQRFEVYALRYMAKKQETGNVLIFGSSRQIKEWFQSNHVWNRQCKPVCISKECAQLFSQYCDVPVYIAKDISAKGLAQIVLEIG
jgi:uroporphyrinogen-III synthase